MVTILLPVYNDEKYLRFTIQSLLNQTFDDYKCLLGFNGTVDGSREIVSSMVDGNPKFTIIDYGEEKGKAITLNKLLNLVDTEFFCLIDGDDIWENNKLESQIRFVKENPKVDVVGTFASYINENNFRYFNLDLATGDYNIRKNILSGNNQIVNSSCFLKTDHALDINGWDPTVEGLEDFDFWVKLAKKEKIFDNIPQYLVYHRVHQKSNFNAKSLPYTTLDILNKNDIHVN